jgi:UDP-N-acetylmuramoyl-L-alanyl-D-glutamate--2,6-diaminopimelate ligase
MDFHQNFDNYFAAKKKLFDVTSGAVITNIDDGHGALIAKEYAAKTKVYPLSLKEVSAVKKDIDGVTFRYEKQDFHINLLGEHNIYNALFAVKAAAARGLDLKTIAKGLAALKGVPGRMQRVDKGQPFYVFVDYAYTEEAMKRAFETALPFKKNKMAVLFGCGGQRDAAKRPLMGRCACLNADRVSITNDNPRKEDPEAIFKDILSGAEDCSNYVLIPDRAEAIALAVKDCRAGDILIIAGKGHEDYQILGTKKIHFSDKEQAEKALEKEGYV